MSSEEACVTTSPDRFPPSLECFAHDERLRVVVVSGPAPARHLADTPPTGARGLDGRPRERPVGMTTASLPTRLPAAEAPGYKPSVSESARNRLIVALDVPDVAAALTHAERLADDVGLFKVGLQLFIAEGPSVVRTLRERFPQVDIFLDLKLHDIPNTMRGAIASARSLGCRFITVHAGSGVEHLRACVEEAGDELGVLAVTVLTSQDEAACKQAGHTRSAADLVAMRADCAREAGCAGIVCSGQELPRVAEVAPDLFKVVPGIRPAGSAVGDQKRVMTPSAAITQGATHLVVGRPIMKAEDPAAAAKRIVDEIATAL